MTSNRLPVNVPAIPPKPPVLSLLNSALRPDKTTDPSISGSLEAITAEQLAALPAELRTELEARKGDAWVRGLTYAPENHWPAELRDMCDNTGVDLPSLPAPRGLTLIEEAGKGSVKAEANEYQLTAVNANGETTALAAAKITLSAEGAVKLRWQKVSEAEGVTYNVYGRKAGALKLITSVGPFDVDEAAEFLDTGSKAPKTATPPTSNTTGGAGQYTNLPNVIAIPYMLETEDYCSTFGFEARDFKGRAERLLENAQHQAVEREFWTGALAQAKGLPNNYLTKTGTAEILTASGTPSVARGLQLLQDALQQCGFGGQGMIHTQAQTAPNFLGARRVGALLLDVFDNIIVPGVGYQGNIGPEGKEASSGNAWMFASDLVACRVEDEPTIFTETFSEATDWGQGGEPNTIRMRAQKAAIAYWDNACTFAVEVELAK